jgi:hypothetical protein
LIYVNSNVSDRRLMAIHKEDAMIVWSGQNDQTAGNSSLANIAGVPR